MMNVEANEQSQKKQAPSGFGCSLFMWMGIFMFVGFLIPASITPVNRTLAGFVHCAGASEIVYDEYNAGTARIRSNGTTRTVDTSAFTMTCIFDNGRVKTVDNDLAVVSGFGVGILGGALAGLMIAMLGFLRRSSGQAA